MGAVCGAGVDDRGVDSRSCFASGAAVQQSDPIEEQIMTDTVARQPSTPGGPPVRGVASIAAALGLGAVTAAAACCVLPLALASLGVGAGLAGSFVGLASIRAPLLVLSAVALVVAWAMWWRKRETACAPGDACAVDVRSRRIVGLLIAATVLVGLAAIWGSIEPILMNWVL
ncbi:mercury transporter MerT [Arthrobacter sp. TPD3018]|nr:mercury transporter MerT [Sphingomonas sp. TPD3009]PVE51619.1 mercury transporter MerT [Arthrobacter sp. TPD3018]PVE80529.1 mercury transporter MerT [Sphingomonas melonis]